MNQDFYIRRFTEPGFFPLLLDGGLSNVLEEMGCTIEHPLWTAILIHRDPESIIKAHMKYLEAGAKCIITSSYQASIPGFLKSGFTHADTIRLLQRSVELASEAVERYVRKHPHSPRPLIAASIGPYGAYLADGSEYHGKYKVSRNELKEFHLERLQILMNSHADLLACETVPNFMETEVIAELLNNAIKPAWVSFSCRDEEHIRDGTQIRKCVEILEPVNPIFAIGVNCTSPRWITGLIRQIRQCGTRKKIVVYPNSGETYEPISKKWNGMNEPDQFLQWAREWQKEGAELIGGCCRIGPSHIRELNTGMDWQNGD